MMSQANVRRAGIATISICTLAFAGLFAASASADSLSRSMDVNGTPEAVWSVIGPFCAIKDWHPAIGVCTENSNATPPTRTLVTKDGQATFVEAQTLRNDAEHLYSYTFLSSPLPVKNYHATFAVVAKSDGVSTVTWSGNYTPDAGKEKAAQDALTGIYESGLESIKAKLAQ
jgi:hypothetical protein